MRRDGRTRITAGSAQRAAALPLDRVQTTNPAISTGMTRSAHSQCSACQTGQLTTASG